MLESGELNVDIMMLDVGAKNEIHPEDDDFMRCAQREQYILRFPSSTSLHYSR